VLFFLTNLCRTPGNLIEFVIVSLPFPEGHPVFVQFGLPAPIFKQQTGEPFSSLKVL
jgi:hypothetical protein